MGAQRTKNVFFGFFLVAAAARPAAAYRVLHHHAPGDVNGPTALVMDSSGYLYGTAGHGYGNAPDGAVFRVRRDGIGFSVLHRFTGATEGSAPMSGMVLDATGTLYGTTSAGGAQGLGTVFSMKTDGSGFIVLHDFSVAEGRGYGALRLDGAGHLYGTSDHTVFSIDTTGSGFTVLHTFAGGPTDGTSPACGLVLDGSGTLYGTTLSGDAYDSGIVFSIRTTGADYTILRAFTGPDGSHPSGGLVLDRTGHLYGTTYDGGASNLGIVFSLDTAGTGFTVLHTFTGGASDGANPHLTDLVLDSAGVLHGATAAGGSSNFGTLFEIRTDGSAFGVVHAFDGAAGGSSPIGRLWLDEDRNLYGSTLMGGGIASSGTLFTMKTDGSAFTQLHVFDDPISEGKQPQTDLVRDGAGNLYGVTFLGGAAEAGTLFTMKSDGTGYRVVGRFGGSASVPTYPNGGLVLAGSTLYGTTQQGGAANLGTIYRVDVDGTNFVVLHEFAGGASDGATPLAGLLTDGTTLFGTTWHGGASGKGTVYAMAMSGGVVTLLHSFAGTDGDKVSSRLILDGFSTLYGTTYQGGASGLGTVFKVGTSGTGFQTLHTFSGGAADGAYPGTGLYLDGLGNLYGTTLNGGTSNVGTVFKLTTTGGGFAIVHSFAGGPGDGSGPKGALTPDLAGYLYGTTHYGGSVGAGGIFRVGTTGSGYAFFHSFAGPPWDGSSSDSTLIIDGSANLYGTTSTGGFADSGTDFVIPSSCVGGDFAAPVVTPPLPITIDQTSCCRGATSDGSPTLSAFLSGGTAVDDCSAPARLTPQVAGADVAGATCFGPGQTTVTFRWQDPAAHVGTAASTVTVRLFGDLNLDASVDPSDMVILRSYLNFAVWPGTLPFTAPIQIADLSHDIVVDPSDLVLLRAYFNFAVSCLAP